jgi:hypothetical protein
VDQLIRRGNGIGNGNGHFSHGIRSGLTQIIPVEADRLPFIFMQTLLPLFEIKDYAMIPLEVEMHKRYHTANIRYPLSVARYPAAGAHRRWDAAKYTVNGSPHRFHPC